MPKSNGTDPSSPRSAARTLAGVASAAIGVITIVTILAVVGGILLAAGRNASSHDRIIGAVIVGSALVNWLGWALACYAAQAIGRYIEWRTAGK